MHRMRYTSWCYVTYVVYRANLRIQNGCPHIVCELSERSHHNSRNNVINDHLVFS
jgi:hypothetical protein